MAPAVREAGPNALGDDDAAAELTLAESSATPPPGAWERSGRAALEPGAAGKRHGRVARPRPNLPASTSRPFHLVFAPFRSIATCEGARGWRGWVAGAGTTPGGARFALTAAPRVEPDIAKLVNGPAWYSGEHVQLLGRSASTATSCSGPSYPRRRTTAVSSRTPWPVSGAPEAMLCDRLRRGRRKGRRAHTRPSACSRVSRSWEHRARVRRHAAAESRDAVLRARGPSRARPALRQPGMPARRQRPDPPHVRDAPLDRLPARVPRLAARAQAAARAVHGALLPRRGDRVRRRPPAVRPLPPRRLRPPGRDLARAASRPGRRGRDRPPAPGRARRSRPRTQRHHEAALAGLPDGAFVVRGGEPWLVLGRQLAALDARGL